MKYKVLISYINPFTGEHIAEWVSYEAWNLIDRLTETKLLSPKNRNHDREDKRMACQKSRRAG